MPCDRRHAMGTLDMPMGHTSSAPAGAQPQNVRWAWPMVCALFELGPVWGPITEMGCHASHAWAYVLWHVLCPMACPMVLCPMTSVLSCGPCSMACPGTDGSHRENVQFCEIDMEGCDSVKLKCGTLVKRNVNTCTMSIPWYTMVYHGCLLYTSPSPRDRQKSRMPSSA